MRKNQRRFLCLGISILAALTFSPVLLGQVSPRSEKTVPVITDWSSHHLIFSKPATAEQARRAERDARYRQQQLRHLPSRLAEAEMRGVVVSRHHRRGSDPGINKDWSIDLGTGATVGATNYPAKIAFRPTNATCAGGATQPDVVVYATGLAGSTSQANIAAFDNLYSGCSGDGSVPTVYWGYNTSGGTVTTSPEFSGDGTQMAFIQTDSFGSGNLVLLKWAALSGTIGAPVSLTRVRDADYPTCTAPCMAMAVLRDGNGTLQPDSNSSVFLDYFDDAAYVGDDGGWLHKFTPVFRGVPAEVRSGGWPVQVNSGSPTALNSPVYDSGSGNVFVTDNGGFLYLVDPTPTVTQSGQLDFSSVNDGGPGIVEGPIVDSGSGLVYVFAPSDGSGLCAGAADCTAVYKLSTSFIAGDTWIEGGGRKQHHLWVSPKSPVPRRF